MKPLILTMGEPAGIGAEITAGAWRALRGSGPCFALIDDATRNFGVPVARISVPDEAGAAFGQALPILHRPLPVPVVPGKPNPAHQCLWETVKSSMRSTESFEPVQARMRSPLGSYHGPN